MLIISAGMQKSGSGYLYNILNDLEIEAGNADAREIKSRYALEDLMKQHNNNIGSLSFNKLFRLWRISLKDKDFVVKTHSHPNQGVKILNTLGMIKIIYCYRDPRDVLLSTVDHGKKILSKGHSHSFSHMVDFEVALRNVQGWTKIWKCYNDMHRVLMIKYEDLMNSPMDTLQTIQNFLNISVKPEKCREILWKYSKENENADLTGMHFNKAVTARYATEMTEEQKTACQKAFSREFKLMGYGL